jgi:hypothetical protein
LELSHEKRILEEILMLEAKRQTDAKELLGEDSVVCIVCVSVWVRVVVWVCEWVGCSVVRGIAALDGRDRIGYGGISLQLLRSTILEL